MEILIKAQNMIDGECNNCSNCSNNDECGSSNCPRVDDWGTCYDD